MKSANPDVRLLGLPSDEGSTFLRGAARAPAEIRAALLSDSTNLSSELRGELHGEVGAEVGGEVRAGSAYVDLGDLDLPSHSGPSVDTRNRIETAISKNLEEGSRVVSLGGDHAVTYPVLRAYGKKFQNLTVLHIDAHPDLWEELSGPTFKTDRYSHASPFARAMEEGLVTRLVQVGIRTINDHQREQAQRFGVEVHEMKDGSVSSLCGDVLPTLEGPLYLSLDLDALDPAFAPGVSHHEPGGFSTRDVLDLIHKVPLPLVGADIVELNPDRDQSGMTARVAAKFLKELIAQMNG